MKTLSKLGVLACLGSALFLLSCAGEYYVTDQPAEVVYQRPIAPYDGAVWIDGDWYWSGGRYVYTRGHWNRPRAGHTYVRGNWVHSQRGYAWRRGRWK